MDALAPGSGFLDFRAAFTPEAVAADLEIGHRFGETWSAFAFGEASRSWGGRWQATAGVGLRAVW